MRLRRKRVARLAFSWAQHLRASFERVGYQPGSKPFAAGSDAVTSRAEKKRARRHAPGSVLALAVLVFKALACTTAVNPDGGFPSGDCMRDSTIVAQEIDEAVNETANGCASDSDCLLRSADVECVRGCNSIALERNQLTTLDAELARITRDYCSQMTCRSAGSCVAADQAVCRDGVCISVLIDGGAP